MFKYFILFFLAASCQGTFIRVPISQYDPVEPIIRENGKGNDWTSHLLDFLSLIDVEKVLGVAVQYMHDEEVMNFLGFIIGPDFKQIMWEFESIDEFREAYIFFAEKGYDIKHVIDFINAVLELPPYKPTSRRDVSQKKGLSGFILDMAGALPLEEMKSLFETKLANDPEVAEFIKTIDSPEFMKILKKMAINPKIEEFKSVFESYGIDFKFICSIMEEVFGDSYQGVIFCRSRFGREDFINRLKLL